MPTADELLDAASVRRLPRCLDLPLPSVTRAAKTFAGLSLSERTRAVRDALLADLPGGYGEFEAAIRSALEDDNFTGWMIWPVTEALAVRAVEHDELEAGLEVLALLTPRLTGEFALRTFLDADLDRVLAVVRKWTAHEDEHVRRLASEGTRPLLPWARRVAAIQQNPAVGVPVLDALYRDPSEYVRRSVANHLNDISRADPELAVTTAAGWLAAPDQNTAKVVRHALRTLVKKGDPGALALLGFVPVTGIEVTGPVLAVDAVEIGGVLPFSVSLTNTGDAPARLVVDYVVHYLKANGKLAPKVFKLATRELQPGETVAFERRHALKELTTRRHYAGEHAIEVQVNGVQYGKTGFRLG